MEKNTAGKWVVFAYGNPSHASAGLPITGDAANITANVRIDGGAANAVDDVNPTELEDGYYVFDITAAEANGDLISIHPASATANVIVIGVPGAVWTRPANFNDLSVTATTGRVDIDSIAGTAQTANDNGADINTLITQVGTAGAGLTNLGGSGNNWNVGKTGYSLTATTGLGNQTANITGNLSGSVGSVTGHTPQTGDTYGALGATALSNISDQFDGTGLTGDTFPARQDQLNSLSSGSAAINTTAESFTATTAGTPTNTFSDTATLDGTYHILPPSAGTTDVYYQFDVTGDGVPVQAQWDGYMQANGDSYGIYAWNWAGASWDQIGTRAAANGTTPVSDSWPCTTAHVGTGADLGKVRIRFQSTDGTNVATDRLLLSYTTVQSSLGFVGGAVWVDTNNGEAGTGSGVGTISRPSNNIADSRTIADANNLKIFHAVPGASFTLAQTFNNYEFVGHGFSVALGGQNVNDCHFFHCDVSGIGTAATEMEFHNCEIGTMTGDKVHFDNCLFNGTFTAGANGDYFIDNGHSAVAGSGSPTFDFTTNITATSTLNVREWYGGGTWNLNSFVTASIEVAKGGGHTIAVGGGDVEFRGFCREISLTGVAATSTVNIIAFTGPIAINGTGGTVNIYGQNSSVTDSSGGSVTINDFSLDTDGVATEAKQDIIDANVDAILIDTGTTIPGVLGTPAANISADIAAVKADTAATLVDTGTTLPATLTTIEGKIDTVDTNVDAILVDTGTTLPGLINNLAIKKNTAFSNFEFLMVLTSDHVTPATGLTVTGQRSIDGGVFASVSGTITEVSNGIYQFDALAADTNGDVITWRFSSATADDTFITFKTVA